MSFDTPNPDFKGFDEARDEIVAAAEAFDTLVDLCADEDVICGLYDQVTDGLVDKVERIDNIDGYQAAWDLFFDTSFHAKRLKASDERRAAA